VLNSAQPCDGFASHGTSKTTSQILFAQNPHPPVSNYQSNKKALLTAGVSAPNLPLPRAALPVPQVRAGSGGG